MKRVATVVALCFAALSAQGQEACTHPKIVKTTGTAELKVTPDQAVIQLGIEHQSSTAAGRGVLSLRRVGREYNNGRPEVARAFNCARRADGEGFGGSNF
jgi:hypothetical protein